ncbi:MAG TPA: enoyl-CoA hydratase-related protein [Acidimicrobiia bacterium]|nr:enoyl-CoA hydratase-related protein [Acidimicrobiia bacterium]
MTEPILERERHGRIELLRLNRPGARNAMSPELSAAIEAGLDDVETDREVTAVVITGAGPVFCAGADLKVVSRGEGQRIMTERGGFGGLVQRDFPKPVIAAVNGLAVAGGFELVLACDLVVAAEDAGFGLPEVSRGLLAAAGGPIRLAKRVPLAVALEVGMTGDPLSAARAYELGLVNRVVPAAELVEVAIGLAERIGRNSPTAVRVTRQLIRAAVEAPEAEGWRLTARGAGEVMASGDAIEGSTAFVEKREPVWNDPA